MAELEPGQGSNQPAGQGAGQPQTFEWEVNGQKYSAALPELQQGYLRQQDYTRKTQEIATQRRELDRIAEEKAIELYAQALQDGQNGSGSGAAPKPDGNEVNGKGHKLPPEVVQQLEKLDSLEQKVHNMESSSEQAQYSGYVASIGKSLEGKYPRMDWEQVQWKFLKEAQEGDDIDDVFERLAKASHDEKSNYDKSVIDKFLRIKANPRALGETGAAGSPSGAGAPPQPAASFAEARERAESRFA